VLTVGVTTASAGPNAGGKSANAKKCQNGGYVNWVRADGTTFANADECMTYASKKGNTLVAAGTTVGGGTGSPPPLTLCAGTETFASQGAYWQPYTFSGGTIDSFWHINGGIQVVGSTHMAYTGFNSGGVPPFKLSFTTAVNSVRVDMQGLYVDPNEPWRQMTLTGYDASGTVVATDSTGGTTAWISLSVRSSTSNIAYFEMHYGNHYNPYGFRFTNIGWNCA
jgi:hypothetical protein